MIHLQNGYQKVAIDHGELVSYTVNDYEFIHQKGRPGWRNSDTEMFPIIGPTQEAGFLVKTPRGNAQQDQHGLLREMSYSLIQSTELKAVFKKYYHRHTEIENSKYPEKSKVEKVFWPYDFEFTKTLALTEDGLSIEFSVTGEDSMPFMLGYHPAFSLYGENHFIVTKNREISISEVIAVGNRAMPILDENTIILKGAKDLEISTTGFSHFMLWTEVPNMVCIEPITFYPYAVLQDDLDKGFDTLAGDTREYKVLLKPFK
jgi:galactose mutarotase-like enzyme